MGWLIDLEPIRLQLLRRNLRQSDLARILNTSEATVSQILRGRRENPRMVARMATAVGLELEAVIRPEKKGGGEKRGPRRRIQRA